MIRADALQLLCRAVVSGPPLGDSTATLPPQACHLPGRSTEAPMRRRLVLTLIALGVTMAFTAAPVAAGTLDQQQTTANNVPPVAAGVAQAQVFTAGLNGQLDQVDVLVSRNVTFEGGPGTDLTVEIWTVTAGVPDSPVPGASVTVLQADVPANTQTWVAVPISAPSVAGTQYAIVLSAPAATLSCPDDCWIWWAFDGDPYAGGAAYATNGPPIWELKQQDQAFRTYVAAPAPSVAASLADAAMAPSSTAAPLATLGFAVLLLASLTTLAFANVRRR